MPVLRLPYGSTYLEAEIPAANLLGVIRPHTAGCDSNEAVLIRAALDCPEGTAILPELARGRKDAVIVISDVTRLMPTARVLPHILADLAAGGIDNDKVTVIIGLGNHRQVAAVEKRELLGAALYGRLKCINSTDTEFVRLGCTRRGTPVEICRAVRDAELTICTGNIEFHRLSGFSGGAKAIMPGVAGREAITHNHAMSELPGVGPGRLTGNPVREDMEEFARIVGVEFLFNVVTDQTGNIIGAYAGDLLAAHRQGCRQVERLYRLRVEKPADIVVVSPGGRPKDASVYQTQKALLNALDICRPGGSIIVAAQCPEGYGDEVFARWLEEADTPSDLHNRLRQRFVLGGHKAKTVLKAIGKNDVFLVSEMSELAVRKLFYHPVGTLQEAVNTVLARHGAGAGIWVMPYGGLCLPELKQ